MIRKNLLTFKNKILLCNFFFKFAFLKKLILKILIHKYGFDFIDFGSKDGGSILFAKKSFKLNKGVGIDILKNFPFIASKKGFVGLRTDILSLPNSKLFDAVIMSHFLEHVPRKNSFAMIEKALNIGKKFIYIQQPFFDENMYLFSNNLKLSYADWPYGHPNMLTTYDFYITLKRLQLKYQFLFSIFYSDPVYNSDSDQIINLDEIWGTVKFNNNCMPKKKIKFDRDIYKEIRILISFESNIHQEYLRKIDYQKIYTLDKKTIF